MPSLKIDNETIIKAFRQYGSPQLVADALNIDVTTAHKARKRAEKEEGVSLPSFAATQYSYAGEGGKILQNRRVMELNIKNGMVFIASDCHYWPGESTVAHQAFITLLKKHKPKYIVLNGDVFDGARISRHEPLFGEQSPTVKQEIEVCEERLAEIADASKNAIKVWTLGNHDIRIFRTLITRAPELVENIDLFSYFPEWKVVWRVDINDEVVIKHRWHNGIHATYNNALKSGKSLITGHLHKLQITPWSDYTGRRYGVDTGTLAEPYGEQFHYTEGNPVNWCSGFAVLTFKDGKLLPPELCEVLGQTAYFRGDSV